jgi:hypothetical protein
VITRPISRPATDAPKGLRVIATRDIIMEDATIGSGETGTIFGAHPDVPGSIEVHWDTPHTGLARWDNCSLLIPPETEEIEAVHALAKAD